MYDNLMNEDWKYLVILDACRFDYFKKVKDQYFPGRKVDKAVSPATSTMPWLKSIFTDVYDDVTYISANPYINSLGVVLEGRFKAVDHFEKIVDVWDFGWSELYRGIHPQEVNNAFFKNHNDSGRYIIHYIQPHYPYIHNEFIHMNPYKSRFESRSKLRVKKFIRDKLVGSIGIERYWKMMEFLRGTYWNQTAVLYSQGGWERVRGAYQLNLEIVLKHAYSLLNCVGGKKIITSDHGELLGEYGLYGHETSKRFPENTEVPWLVIE
jgi:hypothetical protein